MADTNALYSSLLAADEARDAAALAAVAWQMYGQLATTAADLGALRARFRVYAAVPHASGRRLASRRAQTDTCAAAASPGGAPPREMSVQMRKLTAAAPASLGAVEPPAQGARPSGNGQRQVFAASPRLILGASQPSPTSGPDEGHWYWPRHDNGCLAAAGPTALLPVASLGPDLPCTDDPELFFAESPDDAETAKALSARFRAAPKGTSRHDQTDHPPHAAGGKSCPAFARSLSATASSPPPVPTPGWR
jgi:hypothetical protein